jgi:methylenetetrahydrofolate reductase (NADPH)
MTSMQKLFSQPDRFVIGGEAVPKRGLSVDAEFIDTLCADPRVDYVSVTDNAGGNPMASPLPTAMKIREAGAAPLIHLTCKDANRNGLESLAWTYSSLGFEDILVLTGDYPVDGYKGGAQPVFDIDSVGLLAMLNDMNAGMAVPGRKPGTTTILEPTNFFLGCTVSPFKPQEADLVMQYRKLGLKAANGAGFIIPQIGYDMKKSHELLRWMEQQGIDLPVIGNVYKLNTTVARMFHKGEIPGCIVTDALMERIEKERLAEDKGKAFYIDLAAKQIAAFKSMGYRGVHIGGSERYDVISAILDKAAEYEGTSWEDLQADLNYPAKNEFYLLDENPMSKRAQRRESRKHVGFSYRLSRVVHAVAFEGPLSKLGAPFFGWLEKRGWIKRVVHGQEDFWKGVLFECQSCGDCSLAETNYLCPMSQCAKNGRNGPCGGSLDGQCEVCDSGKTCIWVRAYHRAKYYGNESNPLDRDAVIKNGHLKDTSGWANYFLERDHVGAAKQKQETPK